MATVEFRTYQGEAGDLQRLLIGKSSENIEASELYNSTGLFVLFRIRRAKKRICNRLEVITGKKHIEN
jgi:hypothetical protein